MMRTISNFDTLATSLERKDALEIVEAAFSSIDTKTVLHKAITVSEDILTVMGTEFNLKNYRHIYIVGFGKVSCRAAFVLEKLLKGKIRDGAVVGIKEVTCEIVDTYAGTHPLPSHFNVTATKHIQEIAQKATKDDLVLVIVSGGGSALLCSSTGECDQGQKLYEAFLHSGGTIEELNIVRQHVSRLKGGGLAKILYPATVVSLIFSDVPGGDMASIASGPTFPGTSTIEDAQKIINKYNLGEYRLVETNTDQIYFERVHNILLASNLTALNAMKEEASKRGYSAEVVSATQYATPEETISALMGNISNQLALCMGGETKLIVPKGVTGRGGRNTHLGLSMLERLTEKQVFVSFASDGKDNCPAAGAIVDASTLKKASVKSLDYRTYRDNFDSFSFLEQTDDLLMTAPLESNVADLVLLLSPNA